jgi:hypothetical protein
MIEGLTFCVLLFAGFFAIMCGGLLGISVAFAIEEWWRDRR